LRFSHYDFCLCSIDISFLDLAVEFEKTLMYPLFPLAPRYRLDDELPWLEGIDPLRNYWIAVNGDRDWMVKLPGLNAGSFEEFKQKMRQFRALKSGEIMELGNRDRQVQLLCISSNCFAIATENQGAPVWHLFDMETLDSLLMTAHPDWQCSEKDMDLGRRMLESSWQQDAVA